MENIYCRVEPLNPTVDILCSFAALGEPSMPEISTHLFGQYSLLRE